MSEGEAMSEEVSVYTDVNGQKRWRVLCDNGNNTGNGGEGYANYTDAVKGMRSCHRALSRFLEAFGQEGKE